MAKKIRNIFAIKNRLQLKYVVLLLFSMLIPTIFTGICMYYFIFVIVREGAGTPEPIAYNLFPVLRRLNLVMGAGLFIIFVIFLMIGYYISYKLMGPINRLKKELTEIRDGNMQHRIKMRKGDDLLFIGTLINQILDKMARTKTR